MYNITSREALTKYIFLQGGLGNQLFQIAFGEFLIQRDFSTVFTPSLLNLGLQGSTKRKFDTYEIIKNRKIYRFQPMAKLSYAKVFNADHIYTETDPFVFVAEKIQNILTKKYLIGYFQSLYLVKEVQKKIIDLISRKISIKKPSNSLMIHVRAGDYLNLKNQAYHGVLGIEYYKKAIEILDQPHEKINKIVVVTDDIKYSKHLFKDMKVKKTLQYISSKDPWFDLESLTNSKNIILANSSFSWWSGFLGHSLHSSNIIAPKVWLASNNQVSKELIHKDWKVV